MQYYVECVIKAHLLLAKLKSVLCRVIEDTASAIGARVHSCCARNRRKYVSSDANSRSQVENFVNFCTDGQGHL